MGETYTTPSTVREVSAKLVATMMRLQSGGAGRKTRACINLPHINIHEKGTKYYNKCYLCAELSIQPPMLLSITKLQFQFKADQLTTMDRITRSGAELFRAAYLIKSGV